jgi:hypothetical protein
VISAARALRKARLAEVAGELRRFSAERRQRCAGGRGATEDEAAEERCTSGLAVLDGALRGGLARGAIHELLAAGDGAALSVALLFAARAVARSGWVMFVETRGDGAAKQQSDEAGSVELYPPGVAALGVPLERLVVARAADPVDALWVCEQALRCRAVAAVIAPLGRIEPYASRRLQLAAEAGGGVGLIVARRGAPPRYQDTKNGEGENGGGEQSDGATERRRDQGIEGPRDRGMGRPGPTPPWSALGGGTVCGGGVSGDPARTATGAAFAATRILFQPLVGGTEGRRMLVSVLKVREGRPPEPFVLELPDAVDAISAGAGGSSAPSEREPPHAAGNVPAHAVSVDRPGAAGRAAAG